MYAGVPVTTSYERHTEERHLGRSTNDNPSTAVSSPYRYVKLHASIAGSLRHQFLLLQ